MHKYQNILNYLCIYNFSYKAGYRFYMLNECIIVLILCILNLVIIYKIVTYTNMYILVYKKEYIDNTIVQLAIYTTTTLPPITSPSVLLNLSVIVV